MFVTQPKIFISSTILDMPSERKAALRAVEKMGALPIMSEFTMEAQSKPSLDACLDKVKSSDIYVLILGRRYGWQPDEKESITELEYNTAKESKLPILVFNTTYSKEALQLEFEKKVKSEIFLKLVQDAFELQFEMEKSLKSEIEEKQKHFLNRTEPVYSNLVKIDFPESIYRAELNLNKKEIKAQAKEQGIKLKPRPALFDYVIAAMRLKGISFPHDWVLQDKAILTFHDLQDPNLPLAEIIDPGSVERLSTDEIYSQSDEGMLVFKFLLKKCLETKLFKKGVRWVAEEGLFAFVPISKDYKEEWQSRSIEWAKKKKATRKVVDAKPDLKNKEEIFNLKCLAFRVRFELLSNVWYVAIKPDWVFLWPDFKICRLAFKNIQWQKKNERNIHVFNHLNFILHFLQPSSTEGLFEEYKDYPFLTIKRIERFDFAPIVPDEIWRNAESQKSKKSLIDKSGRVELFDL